MSPAKIRGVKGTRDVLPIDTYVKDDDPWLRIGHYHLIEQSARELFPLYGYREARTPVLERTELFVRGIGEVTDIVGKEMYTFDDHGDSVSLRPENTASLVRAYVEHNISQQEPETKWWYLGPMFRRERQQRGRYRQFTQIGIEAFGSPGPRIDAEQIELLDRWLRTLGISFEMHLNTLGDAACRPKYREALQAYLRSRESELCDECKKRIETNPIRVLDCKNPGCQAVAAGAPTMGQFLCDPCRAHFAGVQSALQQLKVSFVLDSKLVRGLDYYTRTTYEAIATAGLGAQSTVAGGGRYDGLVRELGGPDVPGIGFAAGVERMALLLAQQAREAAVRPVLFIAPLGDAEAARADQIAQELRAAGLACEVSFRKSNVGNQLKRADALGARFALVLGDQELKSDQAKLKELKTGAQHEVALSGLVEWLRGDPMIWTVLLLLGVGQRFLGPPEKKPPDAGPSEHAPADAPLLNPGDDAPMFSGVLHNPVEAGMQRIDVSSLVGAEADADQQKKAVLITFFATWCKPCKKEMPFLEQLYTEYKSKGLQVVSVAIDKDEAAWPQIAELVKQNKVTYPIVKDRYNLIARQYLGDKTALPSVFILDKDGKVVLVKQGYTNDAADFLKAEVDKALR